MAEYLIQGETLSAIANAIREWAGDSVGDHTMTPAEMANSIEWVYEQGWETGYSDAEISILRSCVDWNMTATSNSCTINFINNSSTYYVYIDFEVIAQTSGMSYTDEIVIPPAEEYCWDNDDTAGWGDLSSEEWELTVYEMRFSKDGT